MSANIKPAASTALVLQDEGGTDVITISTSGNVGVGNGSPAQKLDVTGNINATGALTLGTALAIAEGGTGATDAATARINLALGTAAAEDVGYFATAAQGSLADSAVQPGDDANTLGSGSAADGYVLTADGSGGAAWEAKAPIDLLSSGASIRKSDGTTAILSESSGEVNLTNVNLTSSVGNLPSNRNLIINGDFRVNQRGAASRTATTNAYNYDRWYYDGTYLYQGVEDKSVANGTYTLTWVDSGSDITAAYTVSTDSSNNNGPDSGLTYTSVSNGGNITVSEGTEYSKHLWIRFSGTLANLADVQVEAGTVATPFERRLIGTELALCQRYYQQYSQTSNYATIDLGVSTFSNDTSTVRGAAVFPVPMRAAPDLALASGTLAIDDYGTARTTTIGSYASSTKGLFFVGTGTGYTTGRPSALIGAPTAVITLTAEL